MKRALLFALCTAACSSSDGPSDMHVDAGARHDANLARDVGIAAESAAPTTMAAPDVQAILDGQCASATVQSSLLPSNILFVLDRSGSMACNPPPTTDSVSCEANPLRAQPSQPSKWEIVTSALSDALALLPSSATIAVSYFSNDDRCGVNEAPEVDFALNTSAQRGVFTQSLHDVTPNGGTPLVGATLLAYKHMHDSALAGDISGNQFVVLLTDGAQSDDCSDPPQCTDAASCTTLLVKQEAPKAAGAGSLIRTFVIGAPGSEPSRQALSDLAVAGQTARAGCDPAQSNCHFDMTQVADFAMELPRALADIAAQTVTCDLPVPHTADGDIDYSLVNVVFTSGQTGDASVLPQDATHDCDGGADGWQYSTDKQTIRLCGPTCDRVRGDIGASLKVVLGCPLVLL